MTTSAPRASTGHSTAPDISGYGTAMDEFFALPELREELLKNLDVADLGRCMTAVGREGMGDVVRSLYHTVALATAYAVAMNTTVSNMAKVKRCCV